MIPVPAETQIHPLLRFYSGLARSRECHKLFQPKVKSMVNSFRTGNMSRLVT